MSHSDGKMLIPYFHTGKEQIEFIKYNAINYYTSKLWWMWIAESTRVWLSCNRIRSGSFNICFFCPLAACGGGGLFLSVIHTNKFSSSLHSLWGVRERRTWAEIWAAGLIYPGSLKGKVFVQMWHVCILHMSGNIINRQWPSAVETRAGLEKATHCSLCSYFPFGLTLCSR